MPSDVHLRGQRKHRVVMPALMFGTDKFDIGKYFEFRFHYFQQNLYLMMIMGAMYGVLRVIGAIGLLKNGMWGFVLSVINCTITIALMMFLLPAGIMDGFVDSEGNHIEITTPI